MDSSSLFLGLSISLLKDKGILCFLLPDAFFNIASFEDIRKCILKYKIKRLVNYGKIFKGLLASAQSITIEKTPQIDQPILCESSQYKHTRTQKSFEQNPKHIFNFSINQKDTDLIKFVYTRRHLTLYNNAKWALGIVTGGNERICTKTQSNNSIPIFRGKDIFPNTLKEPSLFINPSLDKCQQVAPLEMYNAKEKLIYRFISNRLVFFYDDKQRYILNSANLLILNKSFPISHQQLCDLFNSDFMNWLFRSLFNTHKILRSDLELLPIHVDYFSHNKNFEETSFLEYLGIIKQDGTYNIKK